MAEDDVTRLTFRSDGEWDAADLVRFARAVHELYTTFLAAHLAREAYRDWVQFTNTALEVLREQIPEPIFYDWYRAMRRLTGKYPGLIASPSLLPGTHVPSPDDVLDSLPAFAGVGSGLRVRRITMASPGLFTFEGLGGVVEQLREFLKDLAFRNRQERQMGELELLEKYLTVQRDNPDVAFPLPSSLAGNKKVLGKALEATATLRQLEREQKLLPPGDHLDDDDSADSA